MGDLKLQLLPYLVGAWAVVWLATFGYLLLLHMRQRRLEQRLSSLE